MLLELTFKRLPNFKKKKKKSPPFERSTLTKVGLRVAAWSMDGWPLTTRFFSVGPTTHIQIHVCILFPNFLLLNVIFCIIQV